MSVLKTISRILTLPIPNKKYRKKARVKFEEILDILFWPEKSKCIRGFKKNVPIICLCQEKIFILFLWEQIVLCE